MGSYGKTTQANDIIIPVHDSSDARVFARESNLIQKAALEELSSQVEETLNRIPEFVKSLHPGYTNADQWTKVRYHDAIAVLGSRGSGKTTFILNALGKICEKQDNEVRNIGIIDPTLIDVKESIFLNIVSRIRAEVDAWRDRSGARFGSSGKYEDFLSKLNNLSRGISQINGIGSRDLSHDAWDSPAFIMEEGLANVLQGEFLERDFHVFIDKALDCLGQKAFIMAFDDIDTNFSRGWDVLEIIRKYLTSPQLIVLLSGDFDLYSCLVRMNQWAHFNKEYLDKEVPEDESSTQFRSRVDSLEDQYLLKIMKPSRRIELRNIEQVLRQHVVKVGFNHTSDDGLESLQKVLIRMLREEYHLSSSTGLEVALGHLIRQPVRTIIQILRSIEDCASYFKSDDIEFDPMEFHFRMARVFDTPLSHFGFHWSRDVLAVQDRFGMNTLALRLIDNNLLEEGASLQLDRGTMESDSAALVMSGLYGAAMWDKPALIGDYFIKVLQNVDQVKEKTQLARELARDELTLFTAEKNAVSAFQKNDNEEKGLAGYFRIKSKTALKEGYLPRVEDVWGKGYSKEDMSVNNFFQKVNLDEVSVYIASYVKTVRNGGELKAFRGFGRYVNTLDSISAHINSWHKSILNALFVSTVSDRTVLSFLSAYQLVGLLALLGGESRGNIEATLQGYLKPKGEESKLGGVGDPDNDDTDDELGQDDMGVLFDEPSFQAFLDSIEKWQEKQSGARGGLQFSVYERIWHRFTKSLQKSELTTPHLGHILETYCAAFLDAVLAEESWSYYLMTGDKRFRFTTESFFDVLYGFKERFDFLANKHVDIKKELPLFSWFLSCPLMPLLLSPAGYMRTRALRVVGAEDSGLSEQDQEGSSTYTEVDYAGVKFDGLYSLMNTICFPRDLAPKTTATDQRDRLLEHIKEYLEKAEGEYSVDYYEFSRKILSGNWNKISTILNDSEISSFKRLSRIARNEIYWEFVTDKDPQNRSFVRPSSWEGKAYLVAFLELYRNQS